MGEQENTNVSEPVEEIGGNLPATNDNAKGEADGGSLVGKLIIGLGAVATVAYIGYKKLKKRKAKKEAEKGTPENEGQEAVYDDDLDDEDVIDKIRKPTTQRQLNNVNKVLAKSLGEILGFWFLGKEEENDMKKFLFLIVIVAIYGAIFLGGCSSKENPTEIPLKEFKYANLLPDNSIVFGYDCDILILDEDDGNYYIFEVSNVNSEQYKKYVLGCKEKGFQDVEYEDEDVLGQYFGAYTIDGKYWVELSWDVETGKMEVCCNKSRNYKEE